MRAREETRDGETRHERREKREERREEIKKKMNPTSSVRLQAARAHKALPHILDLDEITFLWLTRMTMAKEFLSTLNTQTLTCALGRWTAHLDTMLFLFVIGNLFAIFSRRAIHPVFLTNLVVLAMRRAV